MLFRSLTPSTTRNIEQTRALAGEMVAAIRKGASFTEIARQYSVSGSSARGGDVGWAMSEKLPKTFRDALESIENGAVTEPVLLDGAVYILRRSGERKEGVVDASQSRVWLARAILPLAADASDADRLEAGARIERDTEDITGCDGLPPTAIAGSREAGGGGVYCICGVVGGGPARCSRSYFCDVPQRSAPNLPFRLVEMWWG